MFGYKKLDMPIFVNLLKNKAICQELEIWDTVAFVLQYLRLLAQCSILIPGSFIIPVEINDEISTLFFVTFKIKSRDSLILIMFQQRSHKTYASQSTQISSSHSLFKEPVQETDGRAVPLSLSPSGCLPGWLGRNLRFPHSSSKV